MVDNTDRYASALHLLERGLEMIDQKKDPGLWTLSNGLLQLAKAIQQDMDHLKKKVSDIGSDVKGLQ